MRYICIAMFNLICFSLIGQGIGNSLNNNNVVGWSNIPTSLSKEKVSYNDVKGNCFWKSFESVQNALLLLLKSLSIRVACTHQARGGIQFRE